MVKQMRGGHFFFDLLGLHFDANVYGFMKEVSVGAMYVLMRHPLPPVHSRPTLAPERL